MIVQVFILVLLLVFCYEGLCINTVPQWKADAKVDVFMLAAPLFKEQYDDLLSNINAFHAGLRFLNTETKEELVFDYNAIDMINAVFPNLSKEGEINWSTEGTLHVADNMTEYWSMVDYVYTISGEQFNRFVCWAPLYNMTHSDYFLFDVFRTDLSFEANIQKPVMASSSCISFVWYAFGILHDLGANQSPKTVFERMQTKAYNRDVLWFEVNEPPQKVDATNPEVHDELVNFYSKFKFDDLAKNMTWTNFMNKVLELMDNTFYYYRANGEYYKLNLVGNRAAFQFRPVLLPYGEREPDRVHYSEDGRCAVFQPQNSLPPLLTFFIVVTVLIAVAFGLVATAFLIITAGFLISRTNFVKQLLERRKYDAISVN